MQSGNGRGVQLEEVSKAADALLAKGLRPTVERVRQQIGRGSPNTVGPMLEVWFAGLANRLGLAAHDSSLRTVAPAEVRAATEALWSLALDSGNKRAMAAIATDRDALHAAQEKLVSDLNAFAIEKSALSEREHLIQDALDRAHTQTDSLALQLQELRQTLEQKDQEIDALRAKAVQSIAQKTEVLVEHQHAIAGLNEDRRHERERHAANEVRHLQEIDRARSDAKASKRRLEEVEKLAIEQKKDLENVNTAANERIHVLLNELAVLKTNLATSDKRIRDLRELAVISRIPPNSQRARRTKLMASNR